MKNKDEIKQIIDEHFDKIEVPQMQDKLSKMIDAFDSNQIESIDKVERQPKVISFRKIARIAIPVAAALAIIITVVAELNDYNRTQPKIAVIEEDTCQSADEAYYQTKQALELLSTTLGKGTANISKTTAMVNGTKEIINKQFNIK